MPAESFSQNRTCSLLFREKRLYLLLIVRFLANVLESSNSRDGLCHHLVYYHGACLVFRRSVCRARNRCLFVEVDAAISFHISRNVPWMANCLLYLAIDDLNRLLEHQNKLVLNCDSGQVSDSDHIEILRLHCLQKRTKSSI